jgi:hypothetical protein
MPVAHTDGTGQIVKAMNRPSSARFSSCLLVWSLANLGLLACGAFEGGQSGTDSLEAIGVNKPLMKCEADDKAHESGNTMIRKDGCEECVCQNSGEWSCSAVEGCDEQDGSAVTSDPQSGTDTTDAPTNSDPATTSSASEPVEETSGSSANECIELPNGPSIGGSNSLYIAKDSVAQVCAAQVRPSELCMRGTVYDAGEDYANWGGGIGLVMATEADGGVVPFDAASSGITTLTFQLTGVDGFMVRAYLNQVDDPGIIDPTANFLQNSFVLLETSTSGSVTLPLSRAKLPAWTLLDVNADGEPDPDTILDASKLNSVQFFVAAQQGQNFDFNVCIRDLQWTNADGETIIPAE